MNLNHKLGKIEKELEKEIEKAPEFIGKEVTTISQHMGRVAIMIEEIFKWMWKKPIEIKNIYYQMIEIGVNSLPVTSLTSLFTGMVLGLQTGNASRNILNEPLYVGTAVGFSMIKELGPVLTSVVISGRVGAAIAAELGTMKVTEQIDALHTLGTNPIKYLAVPRVIACLIMLPILTLYADLIGIIGGYIVSIYKLGVPSSVYYHDIVDYMKMGDVFHGLIKSFIFAFIIVVVSCYKGFNTEGGAEGVGRATTQTVVISMVLILVSDYFITSILQTFGIG
jgi:phospholipid/cholesterol/gamma-HCH transport system permease protein